MRVRTAAELLCEFCGFNSLLEMQLIPFGLGLFGEDPRRFNSLLEMPRHRIGILQSRFLQFQFSIGDAKWGEQMADIWICLTRFQFSIGDARNKGVFIRDSKQ